MCYNCQEVGHVRNVCPRLSSTPRRQERVRFKNEEQEHNTRSLSTDEMSTCMLTRGEINGHLFKFLVDTGSSRTIILESVFNKCKVEQPVKPVTINLKNI